jgi:hypothetical protein
MKSITGSLMTILPGEKLRFAMTFGDRKAQA